MTEPMVYVTRRPDDDRWHGDQRVTLPCVACGNERPYLPDPSEPATWPNPEDNPEDDDPGTVWAWLRRPSDRRDPNNCPHCGAT
ncbi:hypothetical protein [Kribbella sp. NPDC004536]|uniref:hypothetical protein n=1 Tax=Kribbella sp. NPDC004536 TaxID=3364106 RepID=UPI0036A626E9